MFLPRHSASDLLKDSKQQKVTSKQVNDVTLWEIKLKKGI